MNKLKKKSHNRLPELGIFSANIFKKYSSRIGNLQHSKLIYLRLTFANLARLQNKSSMNLVIQNYITYLCNYILKNENVNLLIKNNILLSYFNKNTELTQIRETLNRYMNLTLLQERQSQERTFSIIPSITPQFFKNKYFHANSLSNIVALLTSALSKFSLNALVNTNFSYKKIHPSQFTNPLSSDKSQNLRKTDHNITHQNQDLTMLLKNNNMESALSFPRITNILYKMYLANTVGKSDILNVTAFHNMFKENRTNTNYSDIEKGVFINFPEIRKNAKYALTLHLKMNYKNMIMNPVLTRSLNNQNIESIMDFPRITSITYNAYSTDSKSMNNTYSGKSNILNFGEYSKNTLSTLNVFLKNKINNMRRNVRLDKNFSIDRIHLLQTKNPVIGARFFENIVSGSDYKIKLGLIKNQKQNLLILKSDILNRNTFLKNYRNILFNNRSPDLSKTQMSNVLEIENKNSTTNFSKMIYKISNKNKIQKNNRNFVLKLLSPRIGINPESHSFEGSVRNYQLLKNMKNENLTFLNESDSFFSTQNNAQMYFANNNYQPVTRNRRTKGTFGHEEKYIGNDASFSSKPVLVKAINPSSQIIVKKSETLPSSEAGEVVYENTRIKEWERIKTFEREFIQNHLPVITDRVYAEIERKIEIEKDRRGLS